MKQKLQIKEEYFSEKREKKHKIQKKQFIS